MLFLPACVGFSPDTDGLILIGKVGPVAALVVERVHRSGGGAVIVLGATLGGQIGEGTAVLGDLWRNLEHGLYCQMLCFHGII